MRHTATWIIRHQWVTTLHIDNVWIIVTYAWVIVWPHQFWITHLLEESTKSFVYFLFDTLTQKQLFDQFVKISWVWPKMAYTLTWLDQTALWDAVLWNDIKFFESISWIWPKIAKRLIIELKTSVKKRDLEIIDTSWAVCKTIIGTLKPLGYTSIEISAALKSYADPIIESNLKAIITHIVTSIKK